MALWKKVQTLDETSLKAVDKYYEDNFPIHVRNLFAPFIEDEIFGKKLDAEDPNHLPLICTFINSLIEQIEARIKAVDADPFYIRQKLTSALDHFKTDFASNQIGLFRIIKSCLDMENSLAAPDNFMAYERDEIIDSCKYLKDRICSVRDEILKNLDQRQSEFESDMIHRSECDAMLNRLKTGANNGTYTDQQLTQVEASYKLRKEDVEKKLQSNVSSIIFLMKELEAHFDEDMTSVAVLQSQILNKLATWKFEQQQVANGATGILKLDKIQTYCEELGEIIWSSGEQIRKAERIKTVNQVFNLYKEKLPPDTIPELNIKIFSLLKELLQETFVVEEQPPQVMKQSTKFPNQITVRHLVGHKLNAHMIPSTVSVRLIEEAMAKKLKLDPNCTITDRGGISVGSRSLEYKKEINTYATTFKNGQLTSFRRSEKKGVGLERVMEDKFCLYFETVLTVGEQKFKISTTSFPAVVISHGSQEAQAVATITWDNGFGEINREPFVVPCKVPWAHLATVLSHKFTSFTGRELSQDHLQTLERKLFRGTPSEYVTWTEFCKDNMLGANFSFWSWCYEIIKLIEKYLKGPWCEGSIMGIIERETAESMLSSCLPGTFLARFSDSRLGAISITWIHSDGKVYSVNPLTKNDLCTKGFADTIMDLDKLQYLYPNTPKADAFGKHRKPATSSTSGINPYVPLISDINVPGNSNIQLSPTSEYSSNHWGYPVSPARSSFSEPSDLMSTFNMDVETQSPGFGDQFLEFLIPTTTANIMNRRVSNGVGSQPTHVLAHSSMHDDVDMNGDGTMVEDVLKVLHGIQTETSCMNNEQMFTQL